MINDLESMLKHRDFYHQSIKYSFNWNLKNHKEKLNQLSSTQEEIKKLGSYLKKVYQGSIPNILFNRRDIPRVSQFKIRGLKNVFLRSISKKLIRTGKIIKLGSNTKLPNYTREVYKTYRKNQFNKTPGHVPILKNILIKDKDSIAIEVPIWITSNNINITGHIDLIQIQNDIIKVIDYKPEGNFMFSLPQVAIYGLLIKKNLKINRLKCISFNKYEGWEYKPEILLTDVRDYLKSHKTPRNWENLI
ncbi:MAG: hypothetical protein ACFE8A_10150 [Candidatus Hodarchaeota archaeon]